MYVEVFSDLVEFVTPLRSAFVVEFGVKCCVPEWKVPKEDPIEEVVRFVP